MRFDNPAWRTAPVRTSLKVGISLARRALPGRNEIPVPYDGGRSLIYADLLTPLGLELYRYGHRDPDLDLVGQMLSPGDVFVDGGANIGLFTLVAAQRVGRSGKVIAFEPGREVRFRLLENVVLNRFTQVEVIPGALSSTVGEALFRVFDMSGAGLNHLAPSTNEPGLVDTVLLTTLDTVITPSDRKRLTLMKLDLEGAELAALTGASAILCEAQPDILLEVEANHLERMGASVAALAEILREHGYIFYKPARGPRDQPALLRLSDISERGPSPNVFATVNVDRARRAGVVLL